MHISLELHPSSGLDSPLSVTGCACLQIKKGESDEQVYALSLEGVAKGLFNQISTLIEQGMVATVLVGEDSMMKVLYPTDLNHSIPLVSAVRVEDLEKRRTKVIKRPVKNDSAGWQWAGNVKK